MRLKEVLKERGMTQRDLADRMGVTEAFVSKIVSGRSASTLDTLQRIADALGVDVAELFAPVMKCPHCGKPIVIGTN